MKKWSEHYMRNFHNKAAIGAGGNINKLHKLSLRSLNKALGLSYIKDQFNMISALDVEERVTQLGLNFDRGYYRIRSPDIHEGHAVGWCRKGLCSEDRGVGWFDSRPVPQRVQRQGRRPAIKGIDKNERGRQAPFYLNRHENLLSQNVPLFDNRKVGVGSYQMQKI